MPVLYKYRNHTRRARQIVTRMELYFSPPEKLNDPYDCQICIRSALRDAISEAKRNGLDAILERIHPLDDVYNKIEADMRGVGVLSLSKSPDNIVMWTHYANNHNGFCAGFDLGNRLNQYNQENEIVGKVDVGYTNLNPFKEVFNEIAKAQSLPSWNEFWCSLISIGMSTKAMSWSYEDEVRIIRKSGGVVQFSPSELVEIIFGMNMQGRPREKLLKKLSDGKWRHVRLREIVRSDGFSISLKDI